MCAVFSDAFIKGIESALDEYDAIAICFSELMQGEPKVDESFVNRYVKQMSGTQVYGKYEDAFDTLYSNLSRITKQLITGSSVSTVCSELLKEIVEFEVPQGTDEKTVVKMCICRAIMALEHYLQEDQDTLEKHRQYIMNPLNKNLETECLVYFRKEPSNFFMCTPEGNEESNYRKKPRGTYAGKIPDLFKVVQPIYRSELPTRVVPHIETVGLVPESIRSAQKLRIAYIPYAGFETFKFWIEGQKAPLSRLSTGHKKGNFFIYYPPELEQANCERMFSLLDKAIDEQKANIVVFPEFVTSPNMLNEMKRYLTKRWDDGDDRPDHLLLVFPGTTCEKSDDGRYNNTLNILKGNGTQLRHTYYKNTPYNENELCEILSDPGKKLIILDVEGVGRILPAICKDAIDPNYTSKFVDIFEPDLILIPAWSRSLDSFRRVQGAFAKINYAASVMCNCCNAVDSNTSTSIGMYCIPTKSKTGMDANIEHFERTSDCQKLCEISGGCVKMLEIDCSAGYPQGKIE